MSVFEYGHSLFMGEAACLASGSCTRPSNIVNHQNIGFRYFFLFFFGFLASFFIDVPLDISLRGLRIRPGPDRRGTLPRLRADAIPV